MCQKMMIKLTKHIIKIIAIFIVLKSTIIMASPLYDQGNKLYKKGQYSDAMALYTKAAKDDDQEAIFAIATMHYYGEGVKKDYTKTKKWLVPNAENGHSESQALLGLMHQKGQGGEVELGKAIEWLEQSAFQCNDTAQNWLSSLLWKHQKEDKDNNVRSFVWAYISAAQKNEDSYSLLIKTKKSLTEDELDKGKAMIQLISRKYNCGKQDK